MSTSVWKRCSSCKKDIEFGQVYWQCNVSTCNRKRTGLYFCSVSCWEAHLPTMRHREAWAVEERAPSAGAWQQEQQEDAQKAEEKARRATSSNASGSAMPHASGSGTPRRRTVASPSADLAADSEVPRDILIVVSKLKKYIKARSGMSTSDGVMSQLSDHLRFVADQAIENAAEAERKTVLARDIPPVPRDPPREN